MSCGGQADTNFYSRQLYGIGAGKTLSLSAEITPTTDSNNSECWTAGFYKNRCPSGWTSIGSTSEGCNATQTRTSCRFANYPTDEKTLARCCLNAHKVGTMDVNGQFPINARPCPANFCGSNQDGDACVDVIEKYCSTQYKFGQEDNEMCWEWAKKTGSPKLDEFCRDSGSEPGLAVIENQQCKDWISDKNSYTKMDNAVRTYCATSTGKQNTKEKGEKICSCFKDNVLINENSKRLVDLGAPLACWNADCRESGYITENDADRIKNCGQFCASANLISVLGNVSGNIGNQISCDAEAAINETNKIKEAQERLAQTIVEPKSNTKKFIAIAAIALAVLIVFIVIVYLIFKPDENKEYMNKQDILEYNVENPQQFYNE